MAIINNAPKALRTEILVHHSHAIGRARRKPLLLSPRRNIQSEDKEQDILIKIILPATIRAAALRDLSDHNIESVHPFSD